MITKKDIDRLVFIHDRLIHVYMESAHTDYLIGARETIDKIKCISQDIKSKEIKCAAPDHIKPCRHAFVNICQYNGHCNFKQIE